MLLERLVAVEAVRYPLIFLDILLPSLTTICLLKTKYNDFTYVVEIYNIHCYFYNAEYGSLPHYFRLYFYHNNNQRQGVRGRGLVQGQCRGRGRGIGCGNGRRRGGLGNGVSSLTFSDEQETNIKIEFWRLIINNTLLSNLGQPRFTND